MAAWLVVVVGLSGQAAAAGKADAKEAYGRATRYFRLNDFQHALDAFKEAYLDYPDASLLYNMGQCQRQLGQEREAIGSYRSYLHERPDATNRAEVEAQIDNLQHHVDDEDARKKAEAQHAEREPTTAQVAPASVPVTAALGSVEATHAPERMPLYKKWWLWTAVGAAAVAIGLGVGLGVGLRPPAYPSSPANVMTVKF